MKREEIQRLTDDDLLSSLFIYKIDSDKVSYAILKCIGASFGFIPLGSTSSLPTFLANSARKSLLKANNSRDVVILSNFTEFIDYLNEINEEDWKEDGINNESIM